MKQKFQPLPEDEPPLDVPQFLARLRLDPGFAEKMRGHYEKALALPLTPDTEELHAAAAKALKALKHYLGAQRAKMLMEKLEPMLLQAPEPSRHEHLKRINALVDDAVDHLLDVMEPERTRLMAALTSLQARLRDLMAKTD